MPGLGAASCVPTRVPDCCLLAAPRFLHLADGAGVAGQLRVGGQEGDAFGEGLGQQQTIEGVLVQRGQAVAAYRVLAGDGQLGVAVVEQTAAQQARLPAEVFPPQRALTGISQRLAALNSSSC